MAALRYLESQRVAHPELADWYSSMADLYERKLWHQLTQKLDQFVALAVFQAGDALVQLYHNFIRDFETKINLLKLAHFAVIISKQYPEKDAAIKYLEDVIDKLRSSGERRVEEPIVYVKMQIAALKLQCGEQQECKKLLEEGRTTLDNMTDVDPSVHGSVHWVSSQYHKSRQEFAEFYKSALLYLAYTSVETLSEDFKLDIAFDLSLAALLGENIYNFGELLAHPIVTPLALSAHYIADILGVMSLTSPLELPLNGVKSLMGTNVEWLYFILQAFNAGDLAKYKELCSKYQAQLTAQPALIENEKKLWEKINILCLMELIFSRPSEERTISLSLIAEKTQLSMDEVEHLLIKSLSVHLIEGVIDQVDGTVRVSWVQPRVLGIPQITALKDRLDNWLQKVHTTLLAVEAETPDLIAA